MDKRKWVSVESTTCFNFENLLTKIKKNLKDRLEGKNVFDFYKLVEDSLKTFNLNGQTFEYKRKANNFGGYRWFIICPKCKKPSLKLFLPSRHADREQRYLCKICHKLKNSSLLLGNTKKYKKVIKPLKKLEKLRAQLLKRGLTPERAKPILDEYEQIEKELASSPEYRLYKFQKEYGVQG